MKETPTQHFDISIRQSLENLPPPPVSGWEQLSDRLDHNVDQQVRNALAGLPSTIPAADWSVMEQKLTQAETHAAREMDAAIAAGLDQVPPPYATGWPALAARLELIGRRREMVGCMKVTEAALLLTFLLLVARFGGPLASTAPATPPPFADAFPITVPTDRALVPKKTQVANTPVTSQETAPEAVVLRQVTAIEALPAPTLATVASLQEPIYRLSPTAITEIVTNTYEPNEYGVGVSPELTLPALARKLPVNYLLNVFASPVDLNQVITPENKKYDVAADDRYTYGRSFGALLDMTQGQNALQIGLIYGRRSYIPTEFYRPQGISPVAFESRDVQYSRLTFETVTIPLNYERILIEGEKWQFRGRLGMAMNVIVKSDFRLGAGQDRISFERALKQYAAENPSGEGRGGVETNTDILDPDPGYFQGGSILANSSFYLNGGLILERLISDRFSIYVSPSVSRAVYFRKDEGGKGPLGDRVHNTTLRVGSRFKLSNK